MATDASDGHTKDRPEPLFVTTHWSVVLAAGHGDTTGAHDALAHLCQTYLSGRQNGLSALLFKKVL
jgi:hypothetical protein